MPRHRHIPVPDAGEIIDLTTAVAYTSEYRAQHPGAPLAHLFGEKVIREVLDQEGTKGIRIYFGVEPGTTKLQLVGVGVNEEGNDQVEGKIMERSIVCPPLCSNPNVLNGL